MRNCRTAREGLSAPISLCWAESAREPSTMNVESIFAVAAQKPIIERPAYLEDACGGDAELRRKVDRLLAAHDAVGEFLESPAQRPTGTVDYAPITEQPGSMIGP